MKICITIICALTLGLGSIALAAPPTIVKHAKHAPDTVTFLGVSSMPVPDMLRAHLNLPDGTGLVVMYVADDSPAAKAGLSRYDVLVKLNEQLLINHERLSALIHASKPGDKVTFSVIHADKVGQIDVELGKTRVDELDQPRLFQKSRRFFDPRANQLPDAHAPQSNHHVQRVDRIELLEDRLRLLFSPEQVDRITVTGQLHQQLEHAPKHHAPDAAQNTSTMAYVDKQHTLTLTERDGHKHMHVETNDGKVLFDGPIDTPDQRNAVPDYILEKLAQASHIRLHTQPNNNNNNTTELLFD